MRTQIVCSNVDQVQAELCTQSHAHTPAAPVATSTTAWASTIAPVATAHISVRFVPNQHAEQLVGALEQHLQSTFAARRSSNTLAISLVRRGDWWYSDPSAPHYVAAARAIESVWQQRPSFIREGGSLPPVPPLARELAAPVLIVPLGQSSDSAHLPNERIRW
jgi:acetylornithine deacetylase/succinyl-diaminopimelate desuccinylase-like protein